MSKQKKNTPNDLDLFACENNLIHALSEGNSRHIAETAKNIYIDRLVGNQKSQFKIGQIVETTEFATFKAGLQWQITEIYKFNGFFSHVAKLLPSPEEAKRKGKKKFVQTVATFRQKDITPCK